MTEDTPNPNFGSIPLRKDPLIHFLIIGILMALLNWVTTLFSSQPQRIYLTTATQQQLVEAWTAASGRTPNPAELDDLIAAHIQDEVLFREAKKRNLEEGDVIIRRRLIQKFEFLSKDITDSPVPSEKTLQAWYEINRSRFALPAQRSLIHIFFATKNPDSAAIKTSLFELQNVDQPAHTETWRTLGDTFPLERTLVEITKQDLSAEFGARFANDVFASPLNQWTGPIRSAFGYHLILVTDETPALTPDFIAVRKQVIEAWQDEQRQIRYQKSLDALTAGYEIVIEGEQP